MPGRLSVERDRDMAALHAQGWSMAEIGKEYGLTRQRVHQIVSREKRAIRERYRRTAMQALDQLIKIARNVDENSSNSIAASLTAKIDLLEQGHARAHFLPSTGQRR
jgi:predicted DNA-binding protein YlxM (UPF0122 family)